MPDEVLRYWKTHLDIELLVVEQMPSMEILLNLHFRQLVSLRQSSQLLGHDLTSLSTGSMNKDSFTEEQSVSRGPVQVLQLAWHSWQVPSDSISELGTK